MDNGMRELSWVENKVYYALCLKGRSREVTPRAKCRDWEIPPTKKEKNPFLCVLRVSAVD